MSAARNLVLVVLLVLAQLLAGAHALEHARGGDKKAPAETCQLCLAAHDLGTALPSALAPLPPVLLPALPDAPTEHARRDFPAPIACQRGPPHA